MVGLDVFEKARGESTAAPFFTACGAIIERRQQLDHGGRKDGLGLMGLMGLMGLIVPCTRGGLTRMLGGGINEDRFTSESTNQAS